MSFEIINGNFVRYITVEDMKKIMSKLKNTDRLYENFVGNLAVFRDNEQIGFVDLSDSVLEFSDESDE